jgi:predicted RNase H-like HicB family nuclease
MSRRNKFRPQRIAEALCQKHRVSVKEISYDVVLHTDTEEGGFWVECPSLPGCDSQGDTVEEALKMTKDAIKGHLEVEYQNAH